MIIDGLAYVGESRLGPSLSIERLTASMNEAGVEGAVVCAAQPHDHRYDLANRALGQAITGANQFIGLARIDPLQGATALMEAERAVSDLGLRGLFLHPWEDSFSLALPEVRKVVAVAAREDLPVVIAAGYPWVAEANQIGALAREFPEVPVLATNGAQINISGLGQMDAANLVDGCPNVLLMTNGVYRDDFLQRVVAEHGAGRLVFGSGFPTMNMEYELRRVQWSAVPDDARPLILGETISRLYGFAGSTGPREVE